METLPRPVECLNHIVTLGQTWPNKGRTAWHGMMTERECVSSVGLYKFRNSWKLQDYPNLVLNLPRLHKASKDMFRKAI